MRLVWVVLLAGCYKPAHEQPCTVACPCPSGLTCSEGVCVDSNGGCGGVADARAIDAPLPDAEPGCFYATQGGFFDTIEFCLDKLSGRGLSGPIVTDPGSPSCDFDIWGLGNNFCVISARTLSVSGSVPVVGSRPLLLVAETITLSGSIDATSYGGAPTGPGADDPFCSLRINGNFGTEGGAGGAGGSFGGVGGTGGDCNTLRGPSGAPVAQRPASLRGGCPGSSGGLQNGSNFGHSGGAVYLLAEMTIDLGSGTILAGGEGGGASTGGGGGGGGGSGGLIVLDAPIVSTGTALVLANGGGGGGGSSQSVLGSDGSEQSSVAAAAGGMGDVTGGDGSTGMNGAPGTTGKGSGGGTVGGGGGGGGGAGYILVFSSGATRTGTFSPNPQ
jgi:hypothetical protein